MKKWLLLIFTCFISNFASADPVKNPDEISITALSAVRLSEVKSSSITLKVESPGPGGSGICRLMIRSNYLPFKINAKLFDQHFKYTRLSFPDEMKYHQNTKGELIFKLENSAYRDGLTISTKDNKSIAANIADIYNDMSSGVPYNDAGVLPGLC